MMFGRPEDKAKTAEIEAAKVRQASLRESGHRGNTRERPEGEKPPARPKAEGIPRENNSCAVGECDILADGKQARNAKLESIERQLYHLIGQIRVLKQT
jgi:hypothetical protein